MPGYDTLSILKRIARAYPEKRLEEDTLLVYLEELADIPAPLLAQAASHHIRTSTYFPRVSELRQAAQQLAGTPQFTNLHEPGVDFLDLEAYHLENVYFKQGEFDAQAWSRLASQFENVGRLHRAIELRQKAQHIQESEVAHERGEEYPPRLERLRYATWDTLP